VAEKDRFWEDRVEDLIKWIKELEGKAETQPEPAQSAIRKSLQQLQGAMKQVSQEKIRPFLAQSRGDLTLIPDVIIQE
jgi:hypothetical protein